MKAHRLAKYFPILEGEEFQMLVEDIRKNGQLNPIVTYKGEILDGINRYRACEELGIDPLTEDYTGDDPLSYVVSINIRRRHMTESQRAALGTEMLPEFEAEAKERKATRDAVTGVFKPTSSKDEEGLIFNHQGYASSSVQAAKVFGVSGPTMQRAKRAKEQAPERFKDIVSGKASVSEVDEELREAKAEARKTVEVEKEIKKLPTEHPKAVKDYLIACATYRDALELAIKAAKAMMFDPSAINMITTKHDMIRDLMNTMEELV